MCVHEVAPPSRNDPLIWMAPKSISKITVNVVAYLRILHQARVNNEAFFSLFTEPTYQVNKACLPQHRYR